MFENIQEVLFWRSDVIDTWKAHKSTVVEPQSPRVLARSFKRAGLCSLPPPPLYITPTHLGSFMQRKCTQPLIYQTHDISYFLTIFVYMFQAEKHPWFKMMLKVTFGLKRIQDAATGHASSVVGLEIHQNIRFRLRHPSTRGQMGEILEFHIRTRAPQSKTYNWRRGDVNTHLNIYTNIRIYLHSWS